MNFDNLVKVSKNKSVKGIPILNKLENSICKECQLGEMTSSSFSSKVYSTEHILDLVHIDLCGSISTKNYHGDKYFILFVDDYSRMMYVMFLKVK